MNEKESEILISVTENVNSMLILSNLAEAAIESDTIEKIWDLYLLFNVFKILNQETLKKLRQINILT